MNEAYKPTGDPETDEVLAQMAAEGQELPDFGKPDEPSKELEKEEEKEAPSVKEKAEETETNSEEEVEESEEEEEEEAVELTTPPKTHSVPIKKYEYEKAKRKELEVALQELKSKSTFAQVDDEIKKFSEENNLPVETTLKLAEIVGKKALPQDLRDKIEFLSKQAEETTFWNEQKEKFEIDFNSTIVPIFLRDNPNAKQSDIDSLRESIDSIAWEKENANKSLVGLYLETAKTRKSTGESSSIKSIPAKKDPTTGDDIASMTPEEFDEYSERMGNLSPRLTK